MQHSRTFPTAMLGLILASSDT